MVPSRPTIGREEINSAITGLRHAACSRAARLLALMRVLVTLRAVPPVLAPPANEEDLDDPWWTYHIAQGRSADAQMSQFRARWLSERAP